MRKDKIGIFLIVALLVYSAVMLASCAQRKIKNIDAKGSNIICFGDSLTFGYGADPGEDFPAVLAKMTDIPVINAGVDGDTSTEALQRLESDVLERDPLLVIVEFGGNDFLRKIPRETSVANMKEIIDRIQARGAMVAIADVSAAVFLKEYSAAFSEIAREKQAIFIPHILSGIITNPALKSDFIHPNADGYKAIAQRIYRVILPYLNQNKLSREFQK